MAKWIAGAGAALETLCVGLLMFVALLSASQATSCGEVGGGAASPSEKAIGGIPANYLSIYVTAGKASGLDWAVLAGVGSIEADHGRLNAPGVTSGTNSSGAGGPMQFLVGTWNAYGVDGDGDGDKDIYDPRDAIPGAANYLKASGAPKDYRRALFAYNHATWYVEDVLRRAAKYRATGPADAAPLGLEVPGASVPAISGTAAPAPGTQNIVAEDPAGTGEPGCAEDGVGEVVGDPIAPGKYLPVPKGTPVTGLFGESRPGHFHAGIDFAAPQGTPIVAIAAGRVSLVQGTAASGGYGNYVCITHGDFESCSAHMLNGSVRVRMGQSVVGGQQIGREGNTGHSFGAHLHFEIRRAGHGTPLCPAPYLGLPASNCMRSSL